jgi:hypothetical protein
MTFSAISTTISQYSSRVRLRAKSFAALAVRSPDADASGNSATNQGPGVVPATAAQGSIAAARAAAISTDMNRFNFSFIAKFLSVCIILLITIPVFDYKPYFVELQDDFAKKQHDLENIKQKFIILDKY